MSCSKSIALAFGLALLLAIGAPGAAQSASLRVGYSDWPGWVAWQVAVDKGWLKQAGIDVEFEWLDYSVSLDAFAAGNLDGVLATNGDTLRMGNQGKGVMIMVTDYSNGNDMIVARSDIKSITDLKGQKIGLEIGLVDHLLLLNALRQAHMTAKDVTIVSSKTSDTPKMLSSGQVAAIAAWEPIAGQAIRSVPGSHAVYTSASAPGLIYDVLTVSTDSLREHRADWVKLIKVWDRVVHYIDDAATHDDAVKIMSARVGVAPEIYNAFLKGTRFIGLSDGKRVMVDGPSVASLYGSTRNVDAFNVVYGIYRMSRPVASFIDPSLTAAALK